MIEDALSGKIDLIITKSVSRFADGKGSVDYSWFLGYDKNFKVNEKQANTVRLIYKLFISGLSMYAITKELMSRGIKSPSGKDKWHISTVKSILTNEKYRSDALLQKQYTADFLQKTRKTNKGEIPQYYVEEHHEAIIPPTQFDFVQAELARREKGGRYSGVNIFRIKLSVGVLAVGTALKSGTPRINTERLFTAEIASTDKILHLVTHHI